MKFETAPNPDTFTPVFDVWESRDPVSAAEMVLHASHGGVTFETKANFVSYSDDIEVKMVANDSDKASDDLGRLKQHATDSFKKYIEEKKWKDYAENFK